MAAIPYMPLYIADYLADTAHLTTLEHGVYLLLIMNYWQKGKPLPNDDDKISKIVKLRIDKWKKMRNIISEFFFVNETEWIHPRIEKELKEFERKSTMARLAGQKSGEIRRDKKRTDVQRTLNERLTNVERTLNHTDTDTDTDTNLILPDGSICEQPAACSQNEQNILVKTDEKKLPNCPHEKIIELYHKILPNNPKVRIWTENRKRNMAARWKQFPHLELWEQIFDSVAESKFLTGQVVGKEGRVFLPGLDWIIKPENIAKILEDRYV